MLKDHLQATENDTPVPVAGQGLLGVAEIQRRALVESILTEMRMVGEIDPPRNKSERNILKQGVGRAIGGEPFSFFVGSCPDYSEDGEKYTHESLGDDVPLLTRHHLEVDQPLLSVLKRHGIKAKIVIMVADVEATDEVFCERFTGGDQREFFLRCNSSVRKTAVAAASMGVESSSFFQEFGYDRFMEYQGKYQKVLQERYLQDSRFSFRVDTDTFSRFKLYRRMYPGIFNSARTDSSQRQTFLVGRTMRTMAQYLTLGRLIGASEHPVAIINHPTTNISVFNDRGKYLLSEDDPRYPQPTIPIFTMTRKVY